jgi:hypothetical protein
MKNKTKTMTAASIKKAIASGSHSLSAVYHAHGGKGNVSGSTTKKMRILVPDVADIIKTAKSGGTVAKVAKPVVAKVAKPVAKVKTKKVQPKASDKAKSLGFRKGSLIGVVFSIGATQKPRLLSEVIEDAAKSPEFVALRDKEGKKLTIAKRRQRARWQYTMIASIVHPTNKGRVHSVETDLDGKSTVSAEGKKRKLKDTAKLVRFEAIAA